MNEELEKLTMLTEAKDKLRFSLREDLTIKENMDVAKENYLAFSKLYEEITKEKYEKSFEELLHISKE